MSILQEFEEIRRMIGEEEYALINKFLDEHKQYYICDVYYREEINEIYQAWKEVQSYAISFKDY